MIFSAWRFSCAALLVGLVVGEVLFPVFFVRAPFLEVVLLSLASLTYARLGARKRYHEVGLTRSKEVRSKKSSVHDTETARASKPQEKQAPKQLTLPENTLNFERHVIQYLLQQLGRTNFHHENYTLQDFNRLVAHPHAWMQAHLWPVVTFPQRKLLRYRVNLHLKTEDSAFVPCPSFNGVADLLLCLQAMHAVQSQVQEPLMMDFPMSALDYPKLVQHLFDCLEKKDSSFFHVLWLVSDMTERHRIVWQRLRELGLVFAECLVAPQVNISSPYAHMTWDVFEKYSTMENYRSTPTSMRRFVSQSTHIILGDVPIDASIAMPFDSLYGPFAGPCHVILGGSEDVRLLA